MEGSIRLILGCDRFTAATLELPVATAPSHPPARRGAERERQTGEGDNLPPALPRRDAWENPSGGVRWVEALKPRFFPIGMVFACLRSVWKLHLPIGNEKAI
jgi:hypothetical protein